MTQNKQGFKVFQASAGSGKTYTIIKEYLELCLGSRKDIGNFRSILAITFTNAAANEMKAKIFGKLTALAKGEKTDMTDDLLSDLAINECELQENAQALVTAIMHDYSSFCVSTIDAFVQKLSHSFAHDLNLPSQYAISLDKDDIAETVVSNIGMQIDETNQFLCKILNDFIDDKLEEGKGYKIDELLSSFIKKTMSENASQREDDNGIKDSTKYDETREWLNAKTDAFKKTVQDFVDNIQKLFNENGIEAKHCYYAELGFWSTIQKLKDNQFEKLGDRFKNVAETGQWYSQEGKRVFSSTLDEIGLSLQELMQPFVLTYEAGRTAYSFYAEQRKMLYLYALRTYISSELKKLTEEEQIVHISEFNKLISKVMGDFSVPFIYEKIGEKIQHLFIDEFQDTSILQWQNLLPLVDNCLAGGHSSIIVGDGKQSIYRFRNGEVEQIVKLPEIHALPQDDKKAAFIQYQNNLIAQFQFHNLGNNFRSFHEIVEFNNAFFETATGFLKERTRKVYVDETEDYGKAVSIEQKPRHTEQGLVQLEIYDSHQTKDYYLNEVLNIIQTLIHENSYSFNDITILVRSNKTGSAIANYLNSNNIPVISEDSLLLTSSDKVLLLINTLRHLVEPENKVFLASMIYYWRSTHDPDFDGNITGYYNDVKSICEGKKSVESLLRINEPDLLQKTLSKSTSLYDLTASLIRIFKIDNCQDAFLNYFMNEIFKWQSMDRNGISDFLRLWDKKADKLSIQSASGDAVRIMTIHKSKGLEFPVVIYPDAIVDINERPGGGRNVPEICTSSTELGFDEIKNLHNIIFRLSSNLKDSGGLPQQLYEEEVESNRLDNLNLLYVAFTRPQQRLYIIAKDINTATKTKKKSKEKLCPILDFAEKQTSHLIKDDALAEIRRVYRFGDSDFKKPILKVKDTKQAHLTVESASSDWFPKTKIDPMPSMYWISDDNKMMPNEWGDLVHIILSSIHSQDDVDSALNPYLDDGTLDYNTAQMLKDRFRQMANNTIIGEAFSPKAIVKNECDILCNGEIIRPDRFAELPDKIFLLDYKTGIKRNSHHIQIKKYIGALQSMVEKEIKAYLVYICDGIDVEPVIMDTLF